MQTGQVIPFAAVGGSFGAISDDGRYAALSYWYYGWYLKVYDLSTCSTSIPSHIMGPVSCSYRDYNPFLQSSSIQNYSHAFQLRFDGSQNLDIYANYNVTNSNAYGTSGDFYTAKYRLLEPNATSASGGYLAMGDSYASGEGAYNYVRGTDESSNTCHLSTSAYSYIMASALSISNFHSVACSGAVTPDMYATRYPTIPLDNSLGSWLPGSKPQKDQVSNAAPSIITLSDGGNDVGFADIIKKCTLEVGDCYSHYEDRYSLAQLINRQYVVWAKLYHDIKSIAPTNVRIYVTGYPSIIAPAGTCAANVGFMTSNNQLFANYLATYLNYVIQQAAASQGIQYVDIQDVDIQDSLDGHRLCETIPHDTAVNGYTSRNDAGGIGPVGSESFHPNVLGQRLIANAVLGATSDLFAAMPAPISLQPPAMTDTDSALVNLLNAPHDNQTIYSYVKDPISTDGNSDLFTYVTGTLTKAIQGAQTGLKTFASYNVSLNSDPTNLGSFTSDASGNLNISATIPNTVTPGYHQVNITGTNMSGQAIDIVSMIYIAFSSTDYDGDGIPNSSDTCPYNVNSGVDLNQDGIDDSCEAYVGIAPLYQAVNGDPNQGQDPTLIYIERNQSVAASLGITDYNPNNAAWVVVGQTASTDDTSSSIASLTTIDTGLNPPITIHGTYHIFLREQPTMGVLS